MPISIFCSRGSIRHKQLFLHVLIIFCLSFVSSNVSDDGTHLVLDHRQELDILTTERYDRGLSDLSGPVLRVVIAYGNHVLIIEVPTDGER